MLLRTGRLLIVLAVLVVAGAAAAEKRVALVIGNSGYKHAPELANPRNDAIDMASILKSLGLTVIEGFDLNKREMDRAIRDFSLALSNADVGVFFYAGHGLQVGGTNYLVPIDAELSTAAALEFEMVRFDLVQRIMEGEAKTNILFLDACRNNPLSRNLARAMGTRAASIGRGLAAAESGVGTLISFSTQPGNVALDGSGRNSPFTGPLVKALSQPGEDVISILTKVRNEVLAATADKQVPWENHALRARFFFNAGNNPVAPSQAQVAVASAAQAAAPRATPSGGVDPERAWAASKDTNDPLVLEAFLRRFGDNFFADLARSRLAELNRASAAAEKSGDRSIVDANKSIELDPRSSPAYVNRGLAFRKRKEFDRSIIDFNVAIELDPGAGQAYFERAYSFGEKGDHDRAITEYGKAIELSPRNKFSYINRGVAWSKKGDLDRAIVEYGKALEIDATTVLAYENRGFVWLDKKDYDKASADFDKVLELDARNAAGLRGRAFCQLQKKDYDASIASYTKSLEIDAGNTAAIYNRGWMREQRKEFDLAETDYKRVLAIDAGSVIAKDGLKRIGRAP